MTLPAMQPAGDLPARARRSRSVPRALASILAGGGLHKSSGAACITDLHGLVLDATPAARTLLGLPAGGAAPNIAARLAGVGDRFTRWCDRALANGVLSVTVKLKHGEPASDPQPFRLTLTGIGGAHSAVLLLFERIETALTDSVLNSIHDGVAVVDAAGAVQYLNSAAALLTGWSPAEAVGAPLGQVVPVVDARRRALFADVAGFRLGESAPADGLCMVNSDGVERAIRLKVCALRDGAGLSDGYLIVFADVSGEAGLRQRLSYQEQHDDLTGLVNRRAFERELTDMLQAQGGEPLKCAMLYLDIDQFKLINNTCGHAAGDRFLVELTGALRARARGADTLARLGGDEFALLLRDCSLDAAMSVARELRRLVRALPFTWQGKAYKHTISIGVVPINSPERSAADILSAADVACFAAKDRGRDRVEVYSHDDVPERHVEMQWVARVNRACDEERFLLYQQPIIALAGPGGKARHYELLLRMVDRFGQIIMPGDFISAAERYGLMPRIDRWTIDQTLSRLLWRQGEDAGERYTLSLNLSGTSLSDPSFLDYVVQRLEDARPEPGTLCFEITETAAIANISQVALFMHELKARGCLFSLDDFGSGLSSFAYLRDLPVDYLKIDGHFIRNLCTDAANAAVVDAFSRIGHALNIQTIAERVEDQVIAERLQELGVDFAQGFFYARPRKVQGRHAFGSAPAVLA